MSEEEGFQQDMLQREREAIEALNRCANGKGKPEDIETLARELGVDIRYVTIDGAATK